LWHLSGQWQLCFQKNNINQNQVMMKKSVFLFLSLMLQMFVSSSVAYSQFTKQDAIDLVLDSIASNRLDSVNIYMEPTALSNQFYEISPYDSIESPYSNYWLAFIDEIPFALWGHSCSYIFINQTNGAYSITNYFMLPVGYATKLDALNTPLLLSVPTLNYSIPYSGVRDAENPHYYAVIFSGYGQIGEYHFWNSLSHMYCALREKGFPRENIFALVGDGTIGDNTIWQNGTLNLDNDEYDDDILPVPCSVDELNNVFQQLETQMTEDDLLFVYAPSHGHFVGDDSYLVMYQEEELWDYELAEMVENINCSQMIFTIFACYSGGFADKLMIQTQNEKRTVITPVDMQFYYREANFTNNNGIDVFPYFLITALRGYHPLNKLTPWLKGNSIGTHPGGTIPPLLVGTDFNPDNIVNEGNNDGTIQIGEAIYYAKSFDTEFNICGLTEYDCGFQEDLLSLKGLSGNVENTQTVEGNFLVGGSLSVENSATLTLSPNSSFTIVNTDITVNSSGNLYLNSGSNIFGELSSELNIYGNISVGTDVDFESIDETKLEINLGANPVSITNGNFTNCQIKSYANPLSITTQSHFINSSVEQSVNNFTISGATFRNSNVIATNMIVGPGLINNTATITGCAFTTDDPAQTAIYLFNYTKFSFTNNTIHGYYNGIHLNQSGLGISGNQCLMNNDIDISTMYGIMIYNSNAALAENHLFNNYKGIGCLNRSSVALVGNPNANTYDEENVIENNTSYEVYASSGSFPWYFKYNAIIDDNNQGNQYGDPLVYYDGAASRIDVKYNCWGNNFDPYQDLFPQNLDAYLVFPTYCPPGGSHKSTEIALDDFLEGLDYFEKEQYADAKASFESIIQLYPKTQYAEAAMKELFSLEKFVANDYGTLKQYYGTNDSIKADTVLAKLAVFLSNKCEIEMQNWQTAIDHFEGIIENPETPEDSIFAIIDLGYTYLLMGDSSYKSTAQGRLLEHKPVSQETFSTKRDYLLSLLPFEKSGQQIELPFGANKQGELLQNVPNPFSNTTNIQFNLNSNEFSIVEIRINDQVGKEVQRILVKSANEGANTIELNMQGLPSGIYYYSLIVNGTQTDTKKMVVVR